MKTGAHYTTLAKLTADLNATHATLTRLVDELRLQPVVTLNGTPYFDEQTVERIRLELADRRAGR